jgi:hypothetical protein
MKRVITIIAAAATLAPAVASAQAHEHARHPRSVVRLSAASGAAKTTLQERTRARTAARAEQNRRNNREEQSEKVSRTLKIGANGELELSNFSGDIIITRGGGSTVQIDALKIARARTAEEAREALSLVTVEFEERGSRAEVQTNYPRGNQRTRDISVSVQYTVTAPENTRISAHSLSGNISANGIKGDLNLETLSGDVVVENAARVILAKSTSGDVNITNLRSDVGLEAATVSGNLAIRNSSARRMELNSVSGNVTIGDVRCERIEAQSISGDIEYAAGFERNGRYELNSHSGSIRVTPSGTTGFELDANSFSGRIQVGLDLQNSRQNAADHGGQRGPGRMRSLRGTYGDGSAVLEITTFSGTVILGRK